MPVRLGAVLMGYPSDGCSEDGRAAGWASGRPSHAPNRPVPRKSEALHISGMDH